MPTMVFATVEQAREHFSGMDKRARHGLADLLDESVRIGEHSAKLYAPKRTRKLEDAISSTPAHERADFGVIEASVGVDPVDGDLGGANNDYPFFVHGGTGLFGPLMRAILPKRAKRMVFFDRQHVVARSVRGQRPQPFIEEAFEEVDQYVDGRIDLLVDEIVVG
jgi:hypothetical protein